MLNIAQLNNINIKPYGGHQRDVQLVMGMKYQLGLKPYAFPGGFSFSDLFLFFTSSFFSASLSFSCALIFTLGTTTNVFVYFSFLEDSMLLNFSPFCGFLMSSSMTTQISSLTLFWALLLLLLRAFNFDEALHFCWTRGFDRAGNLRWVSDNLRDDRRCLLNLQFTVAYLFERLPSFLVFLLIFFLIFRCLCVIFYRMRFLRSFFVLSILFILFSSSFSFFQFVQILPPLFPLHLYFLLFMFKTSPLSISQLFIPQWAHFH